MDELKQKVIDEIVNCGFTVWHRLDAKTFCYYTDGKNIGYAQWPCYLIEISSVHVANNICGTGFKICDYLMLSDLKENLVKGFSMYPNWATESDRLAVNKYKNWDDFYNKGLFSKEKWQVIEAKVKQ